MTDMRHISSEDLSLHAMQLLDAKEADIVQAHLAECAACRAEYQAALGDLEILALTVDLETPSAAARSRFVQQVAKEKRVVPIDAFERPATSTVVQQPASRSNLLPWLGWAVAAGVTFSAISLYRDRDQLQKTVDGQSAELRSATAQMAALSVDAAKARAIMDALTDPKAMRVTLNTTPAAKAPPQGRATYLADRGTLVFIANNLEPLPLEKVYELWLIPADGTAPVPAGTFHPDGRGNASIVAPDLAKGVQAKAFGVTVEAEGGAKTPTLPIILVGA